MPNATLSARRRPATRALCTDCGPVDSFLVPLSRSEPGDQLGLHSDLSLPSPHGHPPLEAKTGPQALSSADTLCPKESPGRPLRGPEEAHVHPGAPGNP